MILQSQNQILKQIWERYHALYLNCSRVTPPGLRIIGGVDVISKTVDSRPTSVLPPSIIRFIFPFRFVNMAISETERSKNWHLVQLWKSWSFIKALLWMEGILIATVLRPAVISSGTWWFFKYHGEGPGQNSWANNPHTNGFSTQIVQWGHICMYNRLSEGLPLPCKFYE